MPLVNPTALVVRIRPPCHQMIPMNQWPNTTATMLAARRKSTYRSRVSGVAPTRSSRRVRMHPPTPGRVRCQRPPARLRAEVIDVVRTSDHALRHVTHLDPSRRQPLLGAAVGMAVQDQ